MFALVDRTPAVAGDEGLEPTAEVVGDLEFTDVWFQYKSRDKVGGRLKCRLNLLHNEPLISADNTPDKGGGRDLSHDQYEAWHTPVGTYHLYSSMTTNPGCWYAQPCRGKVNSNKRCAHSSKFVLRTVSREYNNYGECVSHVRHYRTILLSKYLK